MDEDKRKRSAKRTQAERDEWVTKWRASGKTAPAFAAEHGLASSSLYQWIRPKKARGGEGKRNRNRKPVEKPAFTEVSVVDKAARRGAAMTVTLRGGHSVTFEGARVEPAWLGAVLKVVSAC